MNTTNRISTLFQTVKQTKQEEGGSLSSWLFLTPSEGLIKSTTHNISNIEAHI